MDPRKQNDMVGTNLSISGAFFHGVIPLHTSHYFSAGMACTLYGSLRYAPGMSTAMWTPLPQPLPLDSALMVTKPLNQNLLVLHTCSSYNYHSIFDICKLLVVCGEKCCAIMTCVNSGLMQAYMYVYIF